MGETSSTQTALHADPQTFPSSSPSTNNMTVGPDIFDEFEAYRFSDDPDFRAGLPTVIAAIRGKDRSADQIDEMIGRAQWFYFSRMKGVSIPWEEYARRQRNHAYVDPSSPKAGLILSRTESPATSPSGPSHVPLPPKTRRSISDPQDGLQALNHLAEAREMMKETRGQGQGGDDGGGGLSFTMLSRLIAEGRTEEVPVRKIPEGTNEVQPQRASMSARPKPWEMANSLPPPPSSTSSFSYGPGAGLSMSPTFQSNSAYFTSTSYNYSQFTMDNTSYNPSPQPQGQGQNQNQMQTRNWATSGPTISPDLNTLGTLGTEAIYSSDDMFLDPLTPGQSRRTSSNQLSSYQTSPVDGSTSVPMPEGFFDPMDTSLNNIGQGETFNDYLDFDFGQTQTQSKQMDFGGDFNDSNGNGDRDGNGSPSPGVFGTSSSTPLPSSRTTASSSSSNLQSQDHTPTSSRSY